MLQFLEWIVQSKRHIVVFLHNGEVIRGQVLAIIDQVLQIKSEEVICEKINH